jgi:hypothetical protein
MQAAGNYTINRFLDSGLHMQARRSPTSQLLSFFMLICNHFSGALCYTICIYGMALNPMPYTIKLQYYRGRNIAASY